MVPLRKSTRNPLKTSVFCTPCLARAGRSQGLIIHILLLGNHALLVLPTSVDALLVVCTAFGVCFGDNRLSYKSYLVDPASSHMLVSKIKPCMSKYKHLYTVKLRTAHYISDYLFDGLNYMDNRSNSRANTCVKSRLLRGEMYLLDKKPMRLRAVLW